MSRLKQLQNALGDLNDIQVHENLVKANAGLDERSKPAERARAAGRKRAYAAGVLTGYEDARFADVLEGACKAASTLRQTKPFW